MYFFFLGLEKLKQPIPSMNNMDDKENYWNPISAFSCSSSLPFFALSLIQSFSFRPASVSFQLCPTKQLRLQVLACLSFMQPFAKQLHISTYSLLCQPCCSFCCSLAFCSYSHKKNKTLIDLLWLKLKSLLSTGAEREKRLKSLCFVGLHWCAEFLFPLVILYI